MSQKGIERYFVYSHPSVWSQQNYIGLQAMVSVPFKNDFLITGMLSTTTQIQANRQGLYLP